MRAEGNVCIRLCDLVSSFCDKQQLVIMCKYQLVIANLFIPYLYNIHVPFWRTRGNIWRAVPDTHIYLWYIEVVLSILVIQLSAYSTFFKYQLHTLHTILKNNISILETKSQRPNTSAHLSFNVNSKLGIHIILQRPQQICESLSCKIS